MDNDVDSEPDNKSRKRYKKKQTNKQPVRDKKCAQEKKYGKVHNCNVFFSSFVCVTLSMDKHGGNEQNKNSCIFFVLLCLLFFIVNN